MGKKKLTVIDDSVKTEVKQVKPKKEKVLGINHAEETKELIQKPKREKILGINKDQVKKEDTPQPSEATESIAKKSGEQQKIISGPSKKRSKKYQQAAEKVDKEKNYPIPEAVSLIKDISYSKFPGSLEIHINTNLKQLRGLVQLPFVSGKTLKVLAFGKNSEDCGADMVGDDIKIKEIERGKIDFDVLITTPEWMVKLARVAKVLGPKGLMPNPKNNTITTDLKKAVLELQTGKTEYKTEKVGYVMHLPLGALSQPNEELEQNIKALLTTIGKSKLKKVVLAPTMGPGVKIDVTAI